MGMRFAPTCLRQVSPLLHKTTLTTVYSLICWVDKPANTHTRERERETDRDRDRDRDRETERQTNRRHWTLYSCQPTALVQATAKLSRNTTDKQNVHD